MNRKLSQGMKEIQYTWILGGILFLALVIRISFYGFQYFLQLDDYIQFYGFPDYDSIWQGIISVNLLRYRPMAGLGDAFFWSLFYDNLWIASVLMAGLLAAGVVLLYRVLARYLPVKPFFMLIFALMPMGFEGTYWLSASTRIVVGLFCIGLSTFFLQAYIDRRRIYWFAAFLAVQYWSYGLYEQAIPMALTITFIIFFLNYKVLGKRCLLGFCSVVTACLYFLMCQAISGKGDYSGRAEYILPWQAGYFTFFYQRARELLDVFLKGGFTITAKGFIRGIRLIFQERAVPYGIVSIAASGAFAAVYSFRTKRTKEAEGKLAAHQLQPIIGAVLALAPLSIFFIMKNSFSLRCTVMSYAGIALIADWILQRLVNLLGRRNIAVYGACSFLVMLVFLTASVSELHDYKETYDTDQAVLSAISTVYDEDKPVVGFLNVNPDYLQDQNYKYAQHIHGVTESYWALGGAVNAYMERPYYALPTWVIPIPSDNYLNDFILTANESYTGWEYVPFDNYDDFYFVTDDFQIIHVNYAVEGDKYCFYDDQGKLVSHVEQIGEEYRLLLD